MYIYRPVDSDVVTEELNESGVLAEAKKVGEIPGVIFGNIDGGKLATTVYIAVDATGNVGELGDEVHGVLKGRPPVVLLADAVRIGLGKGRIVVELARDLSKQYGRYKG
jgi:hypothetical protein